MANHRLAQYVSATSVCKICAERKLSSNFASGKICKGCAAIRAKINYNTPEGLAKNKYASIKRRVSKFDAARPRYYGMLLGFTQAEFVSWFVSVYTAFVSAYPGEKPDVDRINNDVGYVPGNLQLLTKAQHKAKHMKLALSKLGY